MTKKGHCFILSIPRIRHGLDPKFDDESLSLSNDGPGAFSESRTCSGRPKFTPYQKSIVQQIQYMLLGLEIAIPFECISY